MSKHPSLKHHLCIDSQSDPVAPVLYELATKRVDKLNLKILFIESVNNLFVDYKTVNFHQYLQELETFWKYTEWKNFQEKAP